MQAVNSNWEILSARRESFAAGVSERERSEGTLKLS